MAAILGFAGIADPAGWIAKVLFVVFLALFGVVLMVRSRLRA